ncbi:hypothetical protein K7X08_015966 [Anisodus acutangulus]|uniref:Uncharacterized protein n=1 Tax=Anisodus acutangulus TaxID=402998 RepID=A0A9Q1QZ74_9SOLA|nr:hypothetical protein K7X08_015966 [Anisodus acutangulus]
MFNLFSFICLCLWQFLQNQGFLVSITNENGIQVWNLKSRSVACDLQWVSNITAFSVINGSSFMYVGDEYGTISVLKFCDENNELLQLPYQILWSSLSGAYCIILVKISI